MTIDFEVLIFSTKNLKRSLHNSQSKLTAEKTALVELQFWFFFFFFFRINEQISMLSTNTAGILQESHCMYAI